MVGAPQPRQHGVRRVPAVGPQHLGRRRIAAEEGPWQARRAQRCGGHTDAARATRMAARSRWLRRLRCAAPARQPEPGSPRSRPLRPAGPPRSAPPHPAPVEGGAGGEQQHPDVVRSSGQKPPASVCRAAPQGITSSRAYMSFHRVTQERARCWAAEASAPIMISARGAQTLASKMCCLRLHQPLASPAGSHKSP